MADGSGLLIRDSKGSREFESHHLRLQKEIPLFSLDTNERSLLSVKAAVGDNGGVLPFFIHPFYNSIASLSGVRAGKREVSRMLAKLQRGHRPARRRTFRDGEVTVLSEEGYLLRLLHFLRSTPTKVIGLGECIPFTAAAIHLFRKMGYRGSILQYDTRYADPQPADGSGDWQKLVGTLRLIDPKTLIVGGQFSRFDTEDHEQLIGCVPAFVRSIEDGLDPARTNLVLSPISFPHWWKTTEKPIQLSVLSGRQNNATR